MEKRADQLLMLTSVAATCADCGDERIFLPVDDAPSGEFCCTSCDAAVFLLMGVGSAARADSRVA